MIEFSELAVRHFHFLSTGYGFTSTIVSPTHVRYESDRVYFDITTDSRDGVCVDYGRFLQPGVLSTDSAERLSLNTFVGAIRTHFGNYNEENFSDTSLSDFAERTLSDLAAGLAKFGRGLIAADPALYQRARELRFWHVGHWTRLWGTSIVLSSDEIIRQRGLVPEILSLIEQQ